jgi:hypothetical protein
MRCRMNVRSVLDFNSLSKIADTSPKLALNVFLGHWTRGISDRVKRCLVSKVRLLEAVRLLLELLQRVYTPFLKAKFACTDKASWTMPVEGGDGLDGWVEAVAVVASIATVAKQDVLRVVIGTAGLTSLKDCQYVLMR